MTATSTDELLYDPTDHDTLIDPHALFTRMRDEAPLYHRDDQDFYAVSRFADIENVLVDRETFVSHRGVVLGLLRSGLEFPGTMIFEDPPAHTIHRALLSRMFTSLRVAGLEAEIRDLCARLMDPLIGSGGFDAVAEIASIVPMRVIGMLIGIPDEDQAGLRDRMLGDRDREGQSIEQRLSGDLFADYIDWRVDHPSDDIMTHLLTAEFADEHGQPARLTRDELLTYLRIVAGAGNGTTRILIGWYTKLLADHPDQRALLVADPSLIPNAIEETLRYEGNTLQNCRYVARDVELHGEVVPAGSFMVTLTPSGNRDERVFEDAQSYDVTRDIHHHLAFGFGSHYCLGQALARLEGRIVLEEMLTRWPEWETDMSGARFMFHEDNRGWDSLPIVVP